MAGWQAPIASAGGAGRNERSSHPDLSAAANLDFMTLPRAEQEA
jgi:hypothetical protein